MKEIHPTQRAYADGLRDGAAAERERRARMSKIPDGYVTVNEKGELNEYWQEWEMDGKRARMIEVFKDADMAEWDKPIKGWRVRPVKLVFLDEVEK